MLQDIQVIFSGDDDDELLENKVEALDDLLLHTEDVDLANGFFVIFIVVLLLFFILFVSVYTLPPKQIFYV